jgi:two-component system response regulator RegA
MSLTRILMVDDDMAFCEVLAGALTKKGYEVKTAHAISEALIIAQEWFPKWVVTDLKMPHASGLELIPKLVGLNPNIRIVVLTGYANIPTAIESIKLGAVHYLAKPAQVDEIIEAFSKEHGNPEVPVEQPALPLTVAQREYIIEALRRNSGNISATARELGMHRRTLQRKMEKLRIQLYSK